MTGRPARDRPGAVGTAWLRVRGLGHAAVPGIPRRLLKINSMLIGGG
jgi:hypothetical protein